MDFKFDRYIQRVYPNKTPLKLLEKKQCGRIQGLSIFGIPPIILGTGKAASNLLRIFIGSVRTNVEILGKVAVGVLRNSRKFSGHP